MLAARAIDQKKDVGRTQEGCKDGATKLADAERYREAHTSYAYDSHGTR